MKLQNLTQPDVVSIVATIKARPKRGKGNMKSDMR